MTNTEGKKTSQPQITAEDSNEEYIYIIEDKEVWFIDYIVGIAFKTPMDFRTVNRYGIGLLESGRSYTELYDFKDFQDFMEENTEALKEFINMQQYDPKDLVQAMIDLIVSGESKFRNVHPKNTELWLKDVQEKAWTMMS